MENALLLYVLFLVAIFGSLSPCRSRRDYHERPLKPGIKAELGEGQQIH